MKKRAEIWYNDSANAESKAADAALPRWREDYTGDPWLENQMSASQPLDFLRSWYNERKRAGAGEACDIIFIGVTICGKYSKYFNSYE